MIVAITAMFALHAHAQMSGETSSSASGGGLFSSVSRVTPQVEILFSTFAGTYTGSEDGYRTSYGAGLLMDFGHSNLVFESGAKYRQIGENYEGSFYTILTELNYVGVPLNLKYYFVGPRAKTDVYLSAGVMPSYLLSQRATYTYKGNGGFSGTVSDLGYNAFDIPATAALGGKFAFAQSWSFNLEANYARSIPTGNVGSTTNSVIGVAAGIGSAF